MKGKKWVMIGITAALVLYIVVGGNDFALAGDETIKAVFAHERATNSPCHLTALKLKELFAKVTDGRVQVEIYPAGQLYSMRTSIDALASNSIQIGYSGGYYLGVIESGWYYTSTPMVWSAGLKEGYKQTKDVLKTTAGKKLLDRTSKKGIAVLIPGGNCGPANWFTLPGKEIRTLEDMRGKKLRVAPDKVALATAKACGASAVTVATPEVPAALSTGMVDGLQSNMHATRIWKIQNTCPNLTWTAQFQYPVFYPFSSKWWNGLPADIRKKLESTFDEIEAYSLKLWYEEHLEGIGYYTDTIPSGLPKHTIFKLSKEERARWIKAVQPALDIVKAMIGEDLFDDVMKVTGNK